MVELRRGVVGAHVVRRGTKLVAAQRRAAGDFGGDEEVASVDIAPSYGLSNRLLLVVAVDKCGVDVPPAGFEPDAVVGVDAVC